MTDAVKMALVDNLRVAARASAASVETCQLMEDAADALEHTDTFSRMHPSLELCVQFSDDGRHIRKWSRIPFKGGTDFYSHPAAPTCNDSLQVAAPVKECLTPARLGQEGDKGEAVPGSYTRTVTPLLLEPKFKSSYQHLKPDEAHKADHYLVETREVFAASQKGDE